MCLRSKWEGGRRRQEVLDPGAPHPSISTPVVAAGKESASLAIDLNERWDSNGCRRQRMEIKERFSCSVMVMQGRSVPSNGRLSPLYRGTKSESDKNALSWRPSGRVTASSPQTRQAGQARRCRPFPPPCSRHWTIKQL